MSRFCRLIVVLMLLWIVLLVIHPAVDLPQTVLRTSQLSSLMLVICSAVVTLAARDPLWLKCAMLRQFSSRASSGCWSILKETCIRRC